MLARTHFVFGLFLALIFFAEVNNKLIFLPVVLIASLLPDIDCMYSYLGKNKLFRPLQFFVKHRGAIHSLTICLIISLAFAFFIPVLAFPFFLGYAGHLFIDSITPDGIRPLWPLKNCISGKIGTGGNIEKMFFYFLIIVSFILALSLFKI